MSVRAIKAERNRFPDQTGRCRDARGGGARHDPSSTLRRGRRWPTPRSFTNASQASPARATRPRRAGSGKLNKQIAADLGVVSRTVKFRARIMDRMQAETAAELMRIAGRLGVGAATAPRTVPPPTSAEAARR
jgi:hypothetical protein